MSSPLRPRLAASLSAVVFAVVAPLTVHAQGANDLVRIEVKTDTDTEKKDDSKQPSAATTVQSKTLQIALSGKPKSPETRTGKWTVYARDLKGKDVVSVDSGDFKIELPVSGQQKVESKKVTMTYTPDHYPPSGRGKVGKKIEATGSRYYGYAVIIKDGDKVVGEAYEPMGLKAEMAK